MAAAFSFLFFFLSGNGKHRDMRKTLGIRHIRILFFFFGLFILPHFWPGTSFLVQLFASDGYPATARKFGGTNRTGSLHIFTCMLLYTTHCVSSKEFIVLLMKIVNKKLNFFKSLILLK